MSTIGFIFVRRKGWARARIHPCCKGIWQSRAYIREKIVLRNKARFK